MASDERSRRQTLPVVFSVVASALISVFLGAHFFSKRRRPDSNSSAVNLDSSQGNPSDPSSSSSTADEIGEEYEVFLSFRGSDNRKGFTDCLYHALVDAGIRAFRDNEELHVGEAIGPKLMRSIKQSKILMPIFSKDYASSKWCLKEVAEMVKCMKENTGQLIMPIFLDVTPDDVQHQTGTYTRAFHMHKKSGFGDKTVQEWRNALAEVVKLKGLELEKEANGHQGEFIKLVVARILGELKRAYLDVGEILVGINDHVEEVKNLLQIDVNDVRIVGIWGMGGIGKTTIAKVIYNQLVDLFGSCCFLSDIRETYRSPKGLQYLQSKLVSDILRCNRMDFDSLDEGSNVLKKRLRNKKVLILLDDVDHIDQLKALVAELDWFRRGSRILVTTREKEVLDQFQVQRTYEVALLSEDQGFELFCKHAFRNDLRPTDFVDLSWDIVKITGRLPLALEVIGSFLSIYRGRRDVWEGTVEQLRMEPNMKVQDKLKISYDALDYKQKEIFLDVACFFIGTDVRLVIPMWDDCKFVPRVGIEMLLLKSLIKIGDGNKLWMHDQLRDLGRHIVEQENNKEPGLRSRLWNNIEVINVLAGQQGTSKVEAICLKGHRGEIIIQGRALKRLSKLRIFQLGRSTIRGDFLHLMPELRWLSWEGTDSNSMPANSHMKNLVVLDLSTSGVSEDWTGWSLIKVAVKLKVLNLTSCAELHRTPDFSTFPQLEVLIVASCHNLVSVDPSIGRLKTLTFLNLSKCPLLSKLPEEMGSMEALVELVIDETGILEIPLSACMSKLEILTANGCDHLREIPPSVGCLTKLRRLSLNRCTLLKELPDSIGQLSSLTELNLSCTGVKKLPDTIGKLNNLEYLKIDCTEVTHLPGSLVNMEKLKVLDASGCYLEGEIPLEVGKFSFLRSLKLDFTRITGLPASIGNLSHLQALHLEGCWYLRALPKLPSSLISLTLELSSMSTLPNLMDLINLRALNISGSFRKVAEVLPVSKLHKLETLFLKSINFHSIPEEIGNFSQIREINISFCGEVTCLPKMPSCLLTLKITYCPSLQKLPDFSNLKSMLVLQIYHCPLVSEIKGLGSLFFLKALDLSYCPLTKLDSLGELESLGDLSIRACHVERLPDLSKLKKLSRLDASECRKLHDIRGIDSLVNLTMLNFSDCESIEWLPRLSNLKLLTHLYLGGCKKLHGVEGLKELKSLVELDISGCTEISKRPDLCKLQSLRFLKMKDCVNITEVPGLEQLGGLIPLPIRRLPNLSQMHGLRYSYVESFRRIQIG